ncbi:MAG: rRNA pseudouridine synthase [Clostridia bacterium]|nr:rRNA pseudouridine synthase [Clostridia bacterium]
MAKELVRLQKFMADNGIASRRKCEELIDRGVVKINGNTAHIGDKVDPKKDKVTVKGRKITVKDNLVYILLHKPRGYITTMQDEQGRKCVAELVKDVGIRIYPVGRLDRESEGMLLMTNDGTFSNAMTHPTHHVPKTYRVTIRPGITDEQIAAFQDGIEIDGRMTAPSSIRVIDKSEGRVVVEVIIYEGRNRQIRKMFEALDIEVARLKRIAVGSVKLGMLPQGKWRELKEDEVRKLMLAAERGAVKDDRV